MTRSRWKWREAWASPVPAAPSAETRGRFGLAPPFGQLLVAWLFTALCLTPALSWAIFGAHLRGPESDFLLRQDLPVLALCLLITGALSLGAGAPAWLPALSPRSMRWVALALAGLVALAGGIGAGVAFGGYTLSADEFMADFDARIFASGQLMAQIPPAWRDYAPALQPMYTLPVPDHSHWASAYLPVNAAMRALALRLDAESWVNPLFSAFSVIAAWGVGRRLWPDRPSLALIAAALLATSAQLTVMAMTAYAMPAHLAFNLAWLWLFLRGGRLGHVGAIAVGVLATGIHQMLFHPLFAAPFILQLWLDRRWALAGLYTAAYAAIGVFWIEYWPIATSLAGIGTSTAAATGSAWFADRALGVLAAINPANFGEMAESLLRFVTWQNPLTAPVALVSVIAAWRAGGALRPLLLGVGLTLAAMLALEPTQTHGWGYRYLHGLLGSVCLIAAWSWERLTAGLGRDRRQAASGALTLACAISLVGLTPLRAWQAWAYVRPYAAAEVLIQRAPEPVVIVDDSLLLFDIGAFVRNDPFLRSGPKVMWLGGLRDDQLRALCAQDRVGDFDGRQAAALGIESSPVDPVDPRLTERRGLLKQLGCATPLS